MNATSLGTHRSQSGLGVRTIGLKKFQQSGTEDLGRDGTGYLIIRRYDCMMGWGGGGSPILK